MRVSIYFLLCLTAFFVACQTPKIEETNTTPHPVMGAWEVESVHWVTVDTTYKIEKAQPGFFYFTPTRYGIMWTPTATPRVPFDNLGAPTEAEMIAGFKSVIFNGGTYTMTDSTITTKASIAKVPGFEGGLQFYKYKIKGDKLTLNYV